jgi:chromosome segregation ATPase
MQVDNSGTTVVLDAKTTQAIEEGKNRITLLQVEELRLKNLKKDLEQQIIKLEADIDYKEGKVAEISGRLDILDEQEIATASRLAELIHDEEKHKAEIKVEKSRLEKLEAELTDKEKTLNAQQVKLNDLIETTQKDWAIAEKAKDIAEEKIKKIDAFLKSL